ncbi:DNA mismatch repair endonuclease MutL [Fulvivirga kasyanovii]|uniref:DNA mismatch repair protein MutL n=1 Tax=Fulvivirga kasyanovii TaxID=396812 RepID=A0ABW9RSI2_9BACT|nr:DNA mismatch repair endonuclease MutL [Fulvivirga kasyanovii]MTI27129.1 DNA mismatch repair endonuclease MutL [Fulvivirga kasyanovii]
MPDIIRLLPDSLANQIAAGEVVQRPASAIKELLENSIDAGATDIKVIIKEAGKTLMQVMDNGKGMSETDARMSLERHATSKISKTEDLFSIRTMGFRGEALASMAAVSQLEIKTRQPDAELGTLLYVEASEVKKQEPVACEQGTSICIKNLFYNVPARRNFLKSNGVEMKHITDEFQRVALANPEVAFSLYQNDLETYNLPAGKLSQRIVNLFGKNYKEQLASCHEEAGEISIHGYIGKPEFAKKTRGEQFFFVNKRFVRSNYLNHAVMNAFEGLLAEGSFPFYVLFIEIDPIHVDVNVHPTKTEIKFDDERTVYAIVRAAAKQALATHNITPALDFSADINLGSKMNFSRETIKDKNYSQFRSTGNSNLQKSNQEHWEKLFHEHPGKGSMNRDIEREEPADAGSMTLTFESNLNTKSESEVMAAEHKKSIFQLHQKYIITQVKSGMMIVDQQAAHERILFEKYMGCLKSSKGASQQTLFPQTLSLNPGDHSLVMEMEEELRALGFLVEPFGKNDIIIKGMPAEIGAANEKEIFEGLIEQFKRNKSELSIPRKENLARALAKRTALKHGTRLSEDEMSGLIDQLFACDSPNYAPNGQVTFYILELNKIDNFFNK